MQDLHTYGYLRFCSTLDRHVTLATAGGTLPARFKLVVHEVLGVCRLVSLCMCTLVSQQWRWAVGSSIASWERSPVNKSSCAPSVRGGYDRLCRISWRVSDVARDTLRASRNGILGREHRSRGLATPSAFGWELISMVDYAEGSREYPEIRRGSLLGLIIDDLDYVFRKYELTRLLHVQYRL